MMLENVKSGITSYINFSYIKSSDKVYNCMHIGTFALIHIVYAHEVLNFDVVLFT